MNTCFIKLTDVETGDPMIINISKIFGVYEEHTEQYGNVRRVVFTDNHCYELVTETLEYIHKVISHIQ